MENKTVSGKISVEQEDTAFNAEELAQIFNYPSIGQLFDDSDSKGIESFLSRLSQTRENLERIIRSGSRDEADRADKAVRALRVTTDFLQTLQTLRQDQNK